MLFEVTADELDPGRVVEHVRRDDAGAVALFYGVVRDHNRGRKVMHLEYDAYPEMVIVASSYLASKIRVCFALSARSAGSQRKMPRS